MWRTNNLFIILILLLIALLPVLAFAQIPAGLKKIEFKSSLDGSYYLQVLPKKEKAKGLVVIFPGLIEHPYSIFMESSITNKCVENGYGVMIPVLSKENDKFNLNDASMDALNSMIDEELKANRWPDDFNIYIGGFSLGGTRAIKFYNYNFQSLKKPKVIKRVFAIDPPLDFKRFLESESKQGSDQLLKLIGEDLKDSSIVSSSVSLEDYSVFCNSSYRHLKLADFINQKLRIYCEPDILWYLENKGRDLYDLNVIDDAAYIRFLKMRNDKNNVELIITQNKGFRKQTSDKNPHSWSILDVDNFIIWLNTD